jgi:hypothetical protein
LTNTALKAVAATRPYVEVPRHRRVGQDRVQRVVAHPTDEAADRDDSRAAGVVLSQLVERARSAYEDRPIPELGDEPPGIGEELPVPSSELDIPAVPLADRLERMLDEGLLIPGGTPSAADAPSGG